jgi:hypothetical protein
LAKTQQNHSNTTMKFFLYWMIVLGTFAGFQNSAPQLSLEIKFINSVWWPAYYASVLNNYILENVHMAPLVPIQWGN